MCFANNAEQTFQLIEADNQMLAVFGEWFQAMDIFSREPELRRVIFGLNAIIRMPNPANLPQIVQQKIGAIGLELSKLIVKVDTVRRRTLKDNEEHVAKGGFIEKEGDSDEEGDEDMDDDAEEQQF